LQEKQDAITASLLRFLANLCLSQKRAAILEIGVVRLVLKICALKRDMPVYQNASALLRNLSCFKATASVLNFLLQEGAILPLVHLGSTIADPQVLLHVAQSLQSFAQYEASIPTLTEKGVSELFQCPPAPVFTQCLPSVSLLRCSGDVARRS
jgi:hypothetical protein